MLVRSVAPVVVSCGYNAGERETYCGQRLLLRRCRLRVVPRASVRSAFYAPENADRSGAQTIAIALGGGWAVEDSNL